MDRDEIIETLNGLIETSRDGEDGFSACADNVRNAVLQIYFAEKAERCREGAEQLEEIVREMGGPARSGSILGGAHRFRVNIRSAIAGMDDDAILAECERGEDAAQRAYEEALNQPLPVDVRRIVFRQYAEVKTNHDRVREMRNATA